MYSDLKEIRKQKEIYDAAMQVHNAIPHPRVMGVIRECGGKMWMMESGLVVPVAADSYRGLGEGVNGPLRVLPPVR